MSAITSTGSRAATHREYRFLFGLTYPLFVAGVALHRLGVLPAGPGRRNSFLAAVRSRAGAILPFAFMG